MTGWRKKQIQETQQMNWQDEQKKVATGVTGGQELMAIPEGFSLIAVKGFYEFMYWLDRCESKGHLENCPDLIDPYKAFDYRIIDTHLKEWVDLTDDELVTLFEKYGYKKSELVSAVRDKLKEKNT